MKPFRNILCLLLAAALLGMGAFAAKDRPQEETRPAQRAHGLVIDGQSGAFLTIADHHARKEGSQ